MPNFPAQSPINDISLVNAYCTLDQLKARLAISSGITTHDTTLSAIILACSRRIDNDTNRVFYSSASQTRYYTPDNSLTLFCIDDILSISEIQTLSSSSAGSRTYGYTWSVNDYDLEPYYGPPYFRIVTNPTGRYAFPKTKRSTKVTGVFGYCETGGHPDAIREACILMAARLFERQKAPLGVTAGNDMTQSVSIMKTDPDVGMLLWPYRKMDIVHGRW